MATALANRYEFVYLFDVENGNPNGDPDAGNMPRIDPETSYGLVTDVCLKRKIRNYVQMKNKNETPHRIYVQEKAVLMNFHNEAHAVVGVNNESEESGKKKGRKGTVNEVEKARDWMCEHFYDVRTFGAVMALKTNCGTVTGPVQINFARSIEPIMPLEISITRMAVATEEEAVKQEGDNRTMGRKHIVPYGLYRAEGYISANFAQKTGFSEDDLALLWEALGNMFDHDRSAARGKMCARRLIAFKHDTAIGSVPAHRLFERITVVRNGDTHSPARAYSDYLVTVNPEAMPNGVELIDLI
jgi:CRISPR-associated protein Csd2